MARVTLEFETKNHVTFGGTIACRFINHIFWSDMIIPPNNYPYGMWQNHKKNIIGPIGPWVWFSRGIEPPLFHIPMISPAFLGCHKLCGPPKLGPLRRQKKTTRSRWCDDMVKDTVHIHHMLHKLVRHLSNPNDIGLKPEHLGRDNICMLINREARALQSNANWHFRVGHTRHIPENLRSAQNISPTDHWLNPAKHPGAVALTVSLTQNWCSFSTFILMESGKNAFVRKLGIEGRALPVQSWISPASMDIFHHKCIA